MRRVRTGARDYLGVIVGAVDGDTFETEVKIRGGRTYSVRITAGVFHVKPSKYVREQLG